MGGRKKLDQFISVVVILLYAVVITIRWIMLYQDVPADAIFAINIIATVIQCLMILVVLYNACGFTGSWIMRLVFVVIALFLIASSITVWIPEVAAKFVEWNIPII